MSAMAYIYFLTNLLFKICYMKEINSNKGDNITTKINTQEKQKNTSTHKQEIRLGYGRVSSAQQVRD